MELFDVIGKRYSHKVAFDPVRKVPDEDLLRIVQAGMAAPSAGNGQSPEFIIVSEEKLVRRIGELSGNVPLRTAPAMIAVLTPPHARQVCDLRAECLIADFAVATLNMLLAATALGYVCGWVDGPFTKPELSRPVSELLGIPEDRLLILFVPVGYAGEPGLRRPKKPFAQRASWNAYAVQR